MKSEKLVIKNRMGKTDIIHLENAFDGAQKFFFSFPWRAFLLQSQKVICFVFNGKLHNEDGPALEFQIRVGVAPFLCCGKNDCGF